MNKNTLYFQISQALTSMNFGIALLIPYILYRGFSLEQAFTLVSFYAAINIISEYPTGLIGDYYSHKLSIILGIILSMFSIILLVMKLPLIGYFVVIALLGIGNALIQGSDVALLKSISSNFKKDFSFMGSTSDLMIFGSSIIGGFLVTIDMRLPWIIQIIPYTIAIFFILIIKKSANGKITPKTKSIMHQSKISIEYVIKHKNVLIVLLVAGILGGYSISVKTLAGSFTDVFQTPPQIISWLVALVFLSRAVGKKFALSMERLGYRTLFLSLMITLIFLAFAQGIYLAGVSLIVGNFFLGTLWILLNSKLIEETSDGIEASVVSLRNVLVRSFSSVYLFVFGLVISSRGFSTGIFITILLFIVLGLLYVRFWKTQDKVGKMRTV